MFQRTFKLLIVSSCLIACSNAMDSKINNFNDSNTFNQQLNTINNNDTLPVNNSNVQSINNSISNFNVINIVNTSNIQQVNINTNDPAINSTAVNNNTLQEELEEQVNNSNKEDAANAKKKKKHKKKKNKSSEQEQKEAVAELQARITKHLKSGKFILFGKLHQQIMNSIKDNKEDKIYSTLNVDPYILDKYKEYYSILEQCIKELLPSKIGKSLVELQFFEVMKKSNKVLIDIYNFLENNYEYTADDDNDVNETIRYVVDDEAGEIDIQNIVGNDILRTIGNLAAAISDLCLYTQLALLKLVFSGLTDNNDFKLACNQFYYIGKVFGIKELLINH